MAHVWSALLSCLCPQYYSMSTNETFAIVALPLGLWDCGFSGLIASPRVGTGFREPGCGRLSGYWAVFLLTMDLVVLLGFGFCFVWGRLSLCCSD